MAASPLALALMMQPPGAQARPGTVAPTDVLGAYNLSANMAEQQYQAKLAQQNALWGGLAGLGAAGLVGASKIPAVQTAIGGWLSPSAAAAAPTAASSTASGVPLWLQSGMISGQSSGAPAAVASAPASVFDTGAAGVPYATADLGAGSVAADMAPTVAADAAGAGAADAGGFALADILPFLFAA